MPKVSVYLDLGSPAFEDDPSSALRSLLDQVATKVLRQLSRSPECTCSALEEDDVVRNDLGTVVGTIIVNK